MKKKGNGKEKVSISILNQFSRYAYNFILFDSKFNLSKQILKQSWEVHSQ